MRGDFRRVLPSIVSINNHKCRVMHQSQELACRWCRYMGHISSNTEGCDGFCDDLNVIAIHSLYVIITSVTEMFLDKHLSQQNTRFNGVSVNM